MDLGTWLLVCTSRLGHRLTPFAVLELKLPTVVPKQGCSKQAHIDVSMTKTQLDPDLIIGETVEGDMASKERTMKCNSRFGSLA